MKLMARVPIKIANSYAAWFYNYTDVPNDLRIGLEKLLRGCKEGKSLRAELKETMFAHPREPIFFAHATLWRKECGLEKVEICEVGPVSHHSVGYHNKSEASLWFADKHGNDNPNYFGWGASDLHGEYLHDEGKAMTCPEAYNLMRTVTSLEVQKRIPFPANEKLYAEVDELTPEPPCPSSKEKGSAIIDNNVLVAKGSLGNPERNIDVWGLYNRIDLHYRKYGVQRSVDDVPPISYKSIVDILGDMGFRGTDIVLAVELLVEHNLLATDGTKDKIEGYRPTQEGTAIWRALNT